MIFNYSVNTEKPIYLRVSKFESGDRQHHFGRCEDDILGDLQGTMNRYSRDVHEELTFKLKVISIKCTRTYFYLILSPNRNLIPTPFRHCLSLSLYLCVSCVYLQYLLLKLRNAYCPRQLRYTLSDTKSSDKIVEISAWCRTFVRRNILSNKNFVRRNLSDKVSVT